MRRCTPIRAARLQIFLLGMAFLVVPAAAQWIPAGAPVVVWPSTQDQAQMTSDGSGGAIVAWRDRRHEITGDIYAQRLDFSGNALWPSGGAPVCTVASEQATPALTTDGAGGAIVVWVGIGADGKHDIFAQRMDASGEPRWIPGGIPVCTAPNEQSQANIVHDGAGGAVVCWADRRNGVHEDIYVQRLDSSGSPLWTPDGVLVCDAQAEQFKPDIASDGAAGAIIVWMDYRNPPQYDLFAQRVDDSGAPLWAPNGIGVATSASTERNQKIVPDGVGGAIVAWSVNGDVLAQRFSAAGDTLWTPGGVLACTYPSTQGAPVLCAGEGDAIVAWSDGRADNGDIYAQRISPSGSLSWSAEGVAVSTASNTQSEPQVVTDGSGGAILCWRDLRSSTTSWDIYAQRLNPSGTAVWTPGGLSVCWAPNYQWTPLVVSDAAGGAVVAWRDLRSEDWDIYAQHLDGAATAVVDRVPTASVLTVFPCSPNPFSSRTRLRFQLSDAATVTLEVFDVAGRRVHRQSLGALEAGLHGVYYDGRGEDGRPLPSGVYVFRMNTPAGSAKGKMVIRR